MNWKSIQQRYSDFEILDALTCRVWANKILLQFPVRERNIAEVCCRRFQKLRTIWLNFKSDETAKWTRWQKRSTQILKIWLYLSLLIGMTVRANFPNPVVIPYTTGKKRKPSGYSTDVSGLFNSTKCFYYLFVKAQCTTYKYRRQIGSKLSFKLYLSLLHYHYFVLKILQLKYIVIFRVGIQRKPYISYLSFENTSCLLHCLILLRWTEQ